MTLKDRAALYGSFALIVAAFAFIAGIVAAPLLYKGGLRPLTTAAREHSPAPDVSQIKALSVPEKTGLTQL